MAERYTTPYIISQVRGRMNDETQPYYVSDTLLLDFINQSVQDMAEALLFPTSEEFTVTAALGQPTCTPPEEIVKPLVLVSRTDGRTVVPVSHTEVEGLVYSSSLRSADWRLLGGDPDYVVTDLDLTRWRWVGIPVSDEVFAIDGFKYLPPIAATTESFDIPDAMLSALHLGVLALAFNIEDSDAIYDPKKAQEYEARWAAAVQDLQGRRQRDKRGAPRTVRYGGY